MKAIMAIMAILLPGAAMAERQCAPFDEAAAMLFEGYGEVPVFWGMTPSGALSVWFSPETETWTVTAIDQAGIACIIAAGQPGGLIDLPIPGQDM